jgi:predicted nucleic acid-binding Zn ribbon protein
MAEKLLQHKHCRNCGKAVLPENEFCDEACNSKFVAVLKKKRMQLLMLFMFAMAMMMVALFMGMFTM